MSDEETESLNSEDDGGGDEEDADGEEDAKGGDEEEETKKDKKADVEASSTAGKPESDTDGLKLIIGDTTLPSAVVGPMIGAALLYMVVMLALVATASPPPPPPQPMCDVSFKQSPLPASILLQYLESIRPKSSWGEWSAYSECSVTCGVGEKFRTRNCTSPYGEIHEEPIDDCEGGVLETSDCTVLGNCPIDGRWSDWSSYSECSTTCGEGSMFRNRTCDNPAPANNGEDCEGGDSETSDCPDNPKCPVDGQWSEWGTFGACSVTCGDGVETKSRACDNPAPLYNGADCIGIEQITLPCTNPDCPPENGGWSDWSEWLPCSQTLCGDGRKSRTKECTNPEPKYGGSECSGNNYEFTICTHEIAVCPVCSMQLNSVFGNDLRPLNHIPGEHINIFIHMRIPKEGLITQVRYYGLIARQFYMSFWKHHDPPNFDSTVNTNFILKKKRFYTANLGINSIDDRIPVGEDWYIAIHYPDEGIPITEGNRENSRGTVPYETLPGAETNKYTFYIKRVLDDGWQNGYSLLMEARRQQKTLALLVKYECT